ncbi:MAG: Ig domain-containing protein [Archangium sp.]|nr:Ig domain-containing protein [Archangium sp.]
MRRAALVLLLLSGCGFNPDLSRFPQCEPGGRCPAGSLCLTEEQRCVPECGESCVGPVDAGVDAGLDAGLDAGADAGTSDAGFDAGVDAGMEDAGPQLALAAVALPAAIETEPYGFTFLPTGGQGSYSFTMDGGVPGFSLLVGGQLTSAAATTVGTFPFTITVKDDAQPVRGQVTTGFSLEVRPLLRIASGVLVEGRQGQAYSQQLSATGGLPPYRWVVDGGTPTAGLSLGADGGVQGSPSATGVVSFGVSVIDAATPPQQASRMVTIDTKLLSVVLAIATRAAADGRVGTAYSQPLKAYGGTPAYTWSIQSGSASLPPGLALTNAGPDWQLSGTPTDAGTWNFTVRVADSLLAGQNQALSITIY